MPDLRRHRGSHPEDDRRFGAAAVPALRLATHDVCWLLSRGYAINSSLKLVGDRYRLDARQRLAVARSSCSDDAANSRQRRRVDADALHRQAIWIDGYNLLTTLEAALGGGVILHGRDGCLRDMSSLHGNYRTVEETRPALAQIGALLEGLHVEQVHWLLDRPVSNSGRLQSLVREIAAELSLPWSVELVNDPDPVLKSSPHVVATSDSQILDAAGAWFNLAEAAIDAAIPAAWIVDLSPSGPVSHNGLYQPFQNPHDDPVDP